MAIVSRQQIYSWFLDFLKPNENHFAALTDSHWHKTEDLIPQDRIENWNEFLQTLPVGGTLKNYALRDAGNLQASDVVSWKKALSINLFFASFADFPTSAKDGDIVQLIQNDDENVTSNIVTLNSDLSQTAGFYEKGGEKWNQIINTNTASGSYFAPTATGAFT